MMADARPCPAECTTAAEIAQAIAEADALLATFGAMLRIAQIDSGSRRAGFRSVELSQLLTGLIETYLPVAEDGEHRLRSDIASDVFVEGDVELLTQAVVNLIENAIEHTPRGSTIAVNLATVGARTVVSVADDGPGIPPGMRERVCKPFVRLRSSRTSGGNGLGLSLVAAVARLHQIDLDLEDNDPGLRVSLRFPVSATA